MRICIKHYQIHSVMPICCTCRQVWAFPLEQNMVYNRVLIFLSSYHVVGCCLKYFCICVLGQIVIHSGNQVTIKQPTPQETTVITKQVQQIPRQTIVRTVYTGCG